MSVSATTNLGAMTASYYYNINTEQHQSAIESLASGSRTANPAVDPSSAAIGFDFGAKIGVLNQASRNVTQATAMLQMVTSVLGGTNDILTRMKVLASQANSGTIGPADRQKVDLEFQELMKQIDNNALINSRWGGVAILGGAPGTVTSSGAQTLTANLLATPPANTFAGTLNTTLSGGLVTGTVNSVQVVANGAAYNVTVQVGDQTFFGTTVPTAGGSMLLQSTTDSANFLVFDYGASVSGLTNASMFETALSQMLGVDTGVYANFISFSQGNIPASMNISAGVGTNPGLFAVSYTYDTSSMVGTFKLTNGKSVWTTTLTNPPASYTGTVNFTNGTAINLSGFNAQTNLAQTTFTVGTGSQVNFQFQVGDQSADNVDISFNGATALSLGIQGSNVATPINAEMASNAVSAAIEAVSSYIAEIGGTYAQLLTIYKNLEVSIQNQAAAKSTFTDADVANTMLDLQTFKGLKDIAGTVFSQSLKDSAQIAQMLQQSF